MSVGTNANAVDNLNGLFKIVYAGKIENLIPDFAILQQKIPFSEATKLGKLYAQPVVLKSEAGFTYNGEDGNLATLNDALAGLTGEAQVKGSEVILRTQIVYKALTQSMGSEKAFKKATALKVDDMNQSMRKRLECSLLYGQMSLGKVSSNSSGVLTITDATWSPGIWAGSEGHVLEAFDSLSASATQDNGDLTITAVDPDAKTITVSGTSAAVDGNSYLWFKGSRTATGFNEMAGLHKIIANTGSLFNINAATYSVWKGNVDTSGGVVSHAKIQSLVAKATARGLMEKAMVLISPKAFATINTDIAALRMFDGSYKSSKAENGVESITFHSTNGELEILSHPLLKEGDLFVVPMQSVKRIGSVDLSFSLGDDQFFQFVPGKNAFELQCMADQAIFLDRPAHGIVATGLTA